MTTHYINCNTVEGKNTVMVSWREWRVDCEWQEESKASNQHSTGTASGERSRRETQRPERQGRQRGPESQRTREAGQAERSRERDCGEGVRPLSREERENELGFTISLNHYWEPDGERAQVYSLLLPLFILLSIIFHFSLPKYCKAASKFS